MLLLLLSFDIVSACVDIYNRLIGIRSKNNTMKGWKEENGTTVHSKQSSLIPNRWS